MRKRRGVEKPTEVTEEVVKGEKENKKGHIWCPVGTKERRRGKTYFEKVLKTKEIEKLQVEEVEES